MHAGHRPRKGNDMTSKQRAYLRGLANTMEPIVHVGKDGVNDNMIKQLSDALEARELVKGTVLQNSPLTDSPFSFIPSVTPPS